MSSLWHWHCCSCRGPAEVASHTRNPGARSQPAQEKACCAPGPRVSWPSRAGAAGGAAQEEAVSCSATGGLQNALRGPGQPGPGSGCAVQGLQNEQEADLEPPPSPGPPFNAGLQHGHPGLNPSSLASQENLWAWAVLAPTPCPPASCRASPSAKADLPCAARPAPALSTSGSHQTRPCCELLPSLSAPPQGLRTNLSSLRPLCPPY